MLFYLITPLVLILLISIPLVNVFRGKKSGAVAKRRLITHLCLFFAVMLGTVIFAGAQAHAATATDTATSTGVGLGLIGVAVATGLSSLGAGVAVGGAAPAAIGAISENPKNFGKAMIFVVMGEGIAIYGLLISMLIMFVKL